MNSGSKCPNLALWNQHDKPARSNHPILDRSTPLFWDYSSYFLLEVNPFEPCSINRAKVNPHTHILLMWYKRSLQHLRKLVILLQISHNPCLLSPPVSYPCPSILNRNRKIERQRQDLGGQHCREGASEKIRDCAETRRTMHELGKAQGECRQPTYCLTLLSQRQSENWQRWLWPSSIWLAA